MEAPLHRRRSRFSFVGALLLVLTLPGLSWAEYFVIERFESDVQIKQDASLEIVETITVRFDSPRHGIYREIPIRYRTDFGDKLRTPIDIKSVRDESDREWPTEIEPDGDVLSIRIGDPDKYVDGLTTYVITYVIRNALLYHDSYDELYWNVTGNDWGVPIRTASATLTLPTTIPAESLQVGCYAGRRGSTDTTCRTTVGEQIRYELARPLDTYEGMTVALGWPKGVVTEPGWWQKLLWRYNLTHIWLLLLPLGIAAFMGHRWYHYGRDPEVREAVTVMYEPPKYNGKHLTPAEVGAVIDERLDQRDITASIIDLAVRGYLKIEETQDEALFGLIKSTDHRLSKLKPADSDLTPFQSQLLNAVFESGSSIEISGLKNRFYKKVNGLKSTLYTDLVNKRLFPNNPETMRQKYAGLGILLLVVGAAVTFWLRFVPPVIGLLSFGVSGLIVFAFANAMPSRTRTGALAHFEALGFREFMDKADMDKIARLGEQNIFYKYLPYAISLDVADQWAKAFEGIFSQAPDWYVPHGGFMRFSPHAFSRSMNTVTAGLASAMFSAPRGSGVGGRSGGFSGGGFGGGGGRSW